MDCANREFARNSRGEPKLSAQVKGFWATPNTMDHLPQRSEEALIRQATTSRKGRTNPANLREQVDGRTVRMWPTPKASLRGDCPSERERNTPDLPSAAKMWSTPAANDGKNGTLPPAAANWDSLPGDVLRTGNSGQLNPDWVDIMMGFPAGWSEPDCDEPQEMPFPAPRGCEQYEWEPPLVATNCPNRANRLKADGNAVVPQIPEILGRLIMAVEGGVNP
jgi:DNA (cytosine-5)-methyltransferase 1